MSADSGSVRNTLGSQSSTSSSGSTTESTRRRREYGKKDRKIVRILTVVAYVVSVSTAAVLLSAYYVFLWSPEAKNKQELPRTLQYTANTTPSSEISTITGDQQQQRQQNPPFLLPLPPTIKGKIPEPSFALSASHIDLKNIRKKTFYLHYVNTNTKAYQQRQIPTPPSTLVMITKILTTIPSQPTTPIFRRAS